MSKLTFYFDYSSPFAYLASTQVERIAKAHDAKLVLKPFLLGGLFKLIGTPIVPLAEFPKVKQAYQRTDMARWAEHWGVGFSFPSRFPMMTVTALRMTLQLEGADQLKLIGAIFPAYWADDRDINDKGELAKIADAAGLDGAALVEGCGDPAIKAKLKDATDGAKDAGVFGAPTFVVDDEVLFWGQDRFDLVEKALDGWRPAVG